MYHLSVLVVFLGVALLLCCSAALPIVPPVFGYMFGQCSDVPSVFRFPCSSVPGFIVHHLKGPIKPDKA